MKLNLAANRQWTSAGYPNAERAILHLNAGQGRTSIARFKAGARAPMHKHRAAEHAYVISGKVQIAGQVLTAGDYLYTEAGEAHDLVALEDSVLFASSELPVEVLEEASAKAASAA
jgi:quercetin dioxygenase-like cupin family protein